MRRPISVTAFVDWKAQMHNTRSDRLQPPERATRTLERTARNIERVLTRKAPAARFSVAMRLYHGWHKGFERTENLRVITTAAAQVGLSAAANANVRFSPRIEYGHTLLSALPSRLHPSHSIHLTNTLRQQRSGEQRGEEMVDTALASDLLHWARYDAGDWALIAASNEHRIMIRMIRHGEEIKLYFDKITGKVTERSLDEGQARTYASYRSLLASDRFGNLRQWANNQRRSLQNLKSAYNHRIPVSGLLSSSDRELDIDSFDRFLVAQDQGDEQAVRVMLIDGPAGIGKTTFIEFLAWIRADGHIIKQHPLILHVKSRSRILTYIQDMIAFSLQRLRLNLTFDQLPVLVRHGLVVLAIDGFDELADPNGYELAWSQVGELVEQVRGHGTLILAGRETFIGQERIRKSIKSLRSTDNVQALTLRAPAPEDARNWLEAERKHELEFPEELFEFGSFALRPFFFVQLADLPPESEFGTPQRGLLFTSLVDAMIRREASKFGAVMTPNQGYGYVQRFLREVARYMADDQTDAIDELALSWVAEVAAPEELDNHTLRSLRERAAFIAFLEEDDELRQRVHP